MDARATIQYLLSREFRIIDHLHDRLPAGQLDWRPAPGMRSTLELLRYLTYAAKAPIDHLLHDDWKEHGRRFKEPAEGMTADQFKTGMAAQQSEVERTLEKLGDDELETRTVGLPWGEKRPLGEAILLSAGSFLTAYRMQLFVHAKASGATALNTYNCWAGIDPPAPKA